MDFQRFSAEIIATLIVIIAVIVFRMVMAKLVRRYAQNNHTLEHRTNLVIKYINLLINIVAFIALIIVWGVQQEDIFLTVSSVTTVIGVAMFAQWSILSNVTSGVILFFFFPFKIGDVIKIHDKDFPVEGEIEDINAFHVDLRTREGEQITYPNNLLLQKGISIVQHEADPREFMD